MEIGDYTIYFKDKYPWSYVELVYLQTCGLSLATLELCEYLARSPLIVTEKMKELGMIRAGSKGPKNTKRIIFICQRPKCRVGFIRSEYDTNRTDPKYCSVECFTIMNRIPVPSIDDIGDDYDNGLSTNDIAKKYQLSKGTIYNIFKKYNLTSRNNSDSLKLFFNTSAGRDSVMKSLKTKYERHGKVAFGGNSKIKRGYRKDLNVSVRSGWEANFLRYLNYKNIKWQYEPKTFFFEGETRGAMAYMPDVYFTNEHKWIEIKGYFKSKDATKIKRLQKHFPEEFKKLQMVVSHKGCDTDLFCIKHNIPVYCYYRDLNKQWKDIIPNWE